MRDVVHRLTNVKLSLGLDIDDTITADPEFFRKLARVWIEAGRKVHIVSSRSPEVLHKTKVELKELGIAYSDIYLLPPISMAQNLCNHKDLGWFQRFLWLKVAYALANGITHFVDDDPNVLSLFSRYAPKIVAINFESRGDLLRLAFNDIEQQW